MSAPKQYGLILPGQQPKKKPLIPQRDTARPSIFDESDDDSDEMPPHMQLPAKKATGHGPGLMEQRIAKQLQEKALKEDPTCFQYDELYDDMETKREQEQQTRSQEPKQPKYISRLMEHAQRRKLENELRVERQVQKEREQEGEEFKDKESFVTSTYRKKLEEMRKLEAEEKRDEYLEAIGDVTKQNDLDGFYRHLYEQKTGSAKAVQKPAVPVATSAGDEEIAYKPISSGAKRAYRKRHASQDDDDGAAPKCDAKERPDDAKELPAPQSETKKIHLTNNIDADSDFSIDSSSDESGDDDNDNNTKASSNKHTAQKEKRQTDEARPMDGTRLALNLPATQQTGVAEPDKQSGDGDATETAPPATPCNDEVPPPPKKDKTKIWLKRTVGDVFDAAVQRYFVRKAARSA